MDSVREMFDSRTGKSVGWQTFGFVGPPRKIAGWCSHCRDIVYADQDFTKHVCSIPTAPEKP